MAMGLAGCPEGGLDSTVDDDTSGVDDSGSPTVDGDDDGYPDGEDCDDTDPSVNPGQTEETYNGVDDDCDETTPDEVCGDGVIGGSESCATCPADCEPVTIDFDTLDAGDVVSDDYDEVLFVPSAGSEVQVAGNAATFGSSAPHFACTAPAGGDIDCIRDFAVEFTDPVASLSLLAVGIETTGTAFSIRVRTLDGGSDVMDIMGAGSSFDPVLVELTSHGAVTSIEVFDIVDSYGVGFDDFTFQAPRATAP